MGNDKLSNAFRRTGVNCYGGFDESNSISPRTYEQLCHNLLSGQPLQRAIQLLPEKDKEQTFKDKSTGKKITAHFKINVSDASDAMICISPVETLGAEKKDDNQIILNGTIKCYKTDNIGNLGFFLSNDEDPQQTNSKFIQYDSLVDSETWENNGCQLGFSSIINLDEIGNEYKYYRAVLYDGSSVCLGEVKELGGTWN